MGSGRIRLPTCTTCGTVLWPVTADVRACPVCDRVDWMPNVIQSDVRPVQGAYDWEKDGEA